MSGDGVVRIATPEDGQADSYAISVCWHREVFWRRGWDVALNSLVNTHGHVPYDRCDGYSDKTGLGR